MVEEKKIKQHPAEIELYQTKSLPPETTLKNMENKRRRKKLDKTNLAMAWTSDKKHPRRRGGGI